ncbi:MAG: PepSY domain-containing protein [Thermoleophilaceae bacterium]
MTIGLAALAAIAAGGIATSAGGSPVTSGSRLDDGKQYLSKAKVTEQQAIAAAQRAESGDLNEVDLEYLDGRLVWNVDVGSKDVKVDAETGQVVRSGTD